MNDQKITALLKKDLANYKASEKAKSIIMNKAKSIQKQKVKQSSIIPLFGAQSFYAKAATVAIIIASSLFAIEFSEVSKERFQETQPQLVDTSINGMDTSLIFNNTNYLR